MAEGKNPYAAAIGRFVSQFRRAHGLTLDDLSRVARSYGVRWTTSRITTIEHGKFAPTIDTLIVLAQTLGQLSGTPLRLTDLFGDAPTFPIPSAPAEEHRRPMLRAALDSALSGKPVALQPSNFSANPYPEDEVTRMMNEAFEELSRTLEEHPLDPGIARQHTGTWTQEIKVLREPASLAEKRAAGRLGISTNLLRVLANFLWGRPLAAEVTLRVGPKTSAQKRGRVTRILTAEIQAAIERGTAELADG